MFLLPTFSFSRKYWNGNQSYEYGETTQEKLVEIIFQNVSLCACEKFKQKMQDSNEDVSTWMKKWNEMVKCPFSKNHLNLAAKIASHFSLKHNYNQLNAFISTVQRTYKETSIWTNKFLTNEIFMLALIDSELYKKQFKEVYRLIEMGTFSDEESLVDVWYRAHYKEQEMVTKKKMTPVRRHRIRVKFPPPSNIRSSATPFRLPKESVEILKSWLASNSRCSPTSDDIERLAENTKLTPTQVKNWMSNNRRAAARKSLQRAKPSFLKPVISAKIPNARLSEALFVEDVNPEYQLLESPTKYLNLDSRMSSSQQIGIQSPEYSERNVLSTVPLLNDVVLEPTWANLKADQLQVMDKTFLGYIPAYRTQPLEGSEPTVMLDISSIENKIQICNFPDSTCLA